VPDAPRPASASGARPAAMRSNHLDAAGPVHLAQWGDAPPAFVLVHGLGGSHLNWMRVAPRLARRGGVVALDLPGFGLTPVAGRSCDLAGERLTLHRLLCRLGTDPVVLIGNSMGGVVAVAEAALHPERVAGLVLVDPALPVPWRSRPGRAVVGAFAAYSVPVLGRRLVRRYLDRHREEDVVAGALALCTADPRRIPGDVYQAHVALERSRRSRRAESDRAFIDNARSIVAMHLRSGPVWRLVARVTAPTLLVHGGQDLLVRVDGVRRLAESRPDWELSVIDEAGHMPMLELPDRFLSSVESWLDAHHLAPGGAEGESRPASAGAGARGPRGA
jgi:pimeloyl-ACP methyl ester carboxylesterase